MITLLRTKSETPSNCNVSCDADVTAVAEYIKLIFNHGKAMTCGLRPHHPGNARIMFLIQVLFQNKTRTYQSIL
jgi:hypothetical protein